MAQMEPEASGLILTIHVSVCMEKARSLQMQFKMASRF